jgi:hypothetical protein|tara:strand:+ start:511 stop:849 length:339 start_codon:yes stop_codon:yes gene_type:complete
MAIISNIVIDQGTTFNAEIDVTDSEGNILNLAGYTAAAQMRRTYSSTTAYNFTASIASEIEGTVNISLNAAATNVLKAGRYVYDVEITGADGSITRVVEGQVEVTPGVTRAS